MSKRLKKIALFVLLIVAIILVSIYGIAYYKMQQCQNIVEKYNEQYGDLGFAVETESFLDWISVSPQKVEKILQDMVDDELKQRKAAKYP